MTSSLYPNFVSILPISALSTMPVSGLMDAPMVIGMAIASSAFDTVPKPRGFDAECLASLSSSPLRLR